jgi:para-aminobenzoate synthetase component 1
VLPKLTPGIVPVPLRATPQQVCARLGTGRDDTVLLESSKAMPGLSGWSWVTGPALATLETPPDGGATLLRLAEGVSAPAPMQWDDPFEAIREVLARLDAPADPSAPEVPEGPAFTGGLAGFLGYDLARHVERLPAVASPDPAWPWMRLHLCDHLLAFDHTRSQWYFCSRAWPAFGALGRPALWADTLARAQGPEADAASSGFVSGPPASRTPPARYLAQVQQVLDLIAAGDIFQANLSHRFEAAFDGDPFALYRALTALNPAPFSAYLGGPGFALASVSPERFLKLSAQGEVVARPIKGTRPRVLDDEALDRQQREALAASTKDRAENLMIVDLMRNDLGRVAQVGSVQVDRLFELEAHPGVWQMVSTVRARLREGRDVADLLRACWPPGSMTGAPKVRAMAVIDTLEPVRRGPYAGAIGYFDAGGAMDLSVVIRTAMVHGGRVMLQVGGGVVSDSQPQAELDETYAKGRLLLQAMAAGGGSPAG